MKFILEVDNNTNCIKSTAQLVVQYACFSCAVVQSILHDFKLIFTSTV